MGYEIEKSVQAARDIEEAFVYIGEENLDAAVYFLVAVEESIEMIASHPLIGSSRHFQNTKLNGLRMWRVKNYEQYLIIYAVKKNSVQILRVINAKRDFNLIFEL